MITFTNSNISSTTTKDVYGISILPQELVGKVLEKMTPLERFLMMETNNKKILDTLADYGLLVEIPYSDIPMITQILNTYSNYRYKFKVNGKMYSKKYFLWWISVMQKYQM